MAMATAAGLLEAMPDKRTFVLSRAGFAGIQRYAANWLGDNFSRWDHLKMSIPMGTGLSISGQSFVGADVGGFAGNSNPELLVRWMQYGSLTPFFRNHTVINTVDQYPWSFGDAVLDLVRSAIELRYRLMPYLYSAFVQASETGAPIQRPLIFDHQHDPVVRDIDDEFLLGRDLLVAPVIEPGTTTRRAYLPQGLWYDWHTDRTETGGRWLTAQTPMDRIPLYARGGAVIPMWADAPQSTAGHSPTVIELHLFVPDDDGPTHESLLQEDDGLTFDAAHGALLRTTFAIERRRELVKLSSTTRGDGFTDFERKQFVVVIHGATPDVAILDERVTTVDDGRVTIPNTGENFTLTFTLTQSVVPSPHA